MDYRGDNYIYLMIKKNKSTITQDTELDSHGREKLILVHLPPEKR